jgi:hypothetical protein
LGIGPPLGEGGRVGAPGKFKGFQILSQYPIFLFLREAQKSIFSPKFMAAGTWDYYNLTRIGYFPVFVPGIDRAPRWSA